MFELEKEHSGSYIVREVDVFTTEQAKAHDVKSVIMMPVNICEFQRSSCSSSCSPSTDGRGGGPWNQLSIHFPGQIKTSIKEGRVHKFPENKVMPLVHISDVSEYYARLLEALIQGRDIPTGRKGYYMVISHSTSWWDILDGFARALHARSLVKNSEVHVWPSDEAASKALEMPGNFVRSIFNSG